MKKNHLLGGALIVATLSLALGGAAFAQAQPDQAVPWQFRDAASTTALQNSLVLIQARKDRNKNLAAEASGSLSGGSGLLGATSSATNNFFETVNQTNVTNECSVAAGASLSGGCGAQSSGSGGNTTSATQTTSGSTNSSTTSLTGNTLTSTPTTTVQTGGVGSTLNAGH